MSSLAAKNPSWMTFDKAAFTSEEGKSFPYVYLSSNAASGYEASSGKLRVWIQGSVHGNEPAGDEAALALLGAMDEDPEWAAEFLKHMDILVLPRYNPDGNACKWFYEYSFVYMLIPPQTSSELWLQTLIPIVTTPSSPANKPETSRPGSPPSLHTSPATCTNTAPPPATQETTPTPPTACTARLKTSTSPSPSANSLKPSSRPPSTPLSSPTAYAANRT